MTDCQAKRNAAMEANPNDVPSIPECKPDGTYSDVQCNRMTQECWCADDNGIEIPNTRTNGTLRCKNDGNGYDKQNQTLTCYSSLSSFSSSCFCSYSCWFFLFVSLRFFFYFVLIVVFIFYFFYFVFFFQFSSIFFSVMML